MLTLKFAFYHLCIIVYFQSSRSQAAISHTSDINEELGLVTHLFSDKTGTITKNEMLLKMYVNNGHVFCAEDDLDMKYDKFMQILCLCHSVQVGLSKSNISRHVIVISYCPAMHFA